MADSKENYKWDLGSKRVKWLQRYCESYTTIDPARSRTRHRVHCAHALTTRPLHASPTILSTKKAFLAQPIAFRESRRLGWTLWWHSRTARLQCCCFVFIAWWRLFREIMYLLGKSHEAVGDKFLFMQFVGKNK